MKRTSDSIFASKVLPHILTYVVLISNHDKYFLKNSLYVNAISRLLPRRVKLDMSQAMVPLHKYGVHRVGVMTYIMILWLQFIRTL